MPAPTNHERWNASGKTVRDENGLAVAHCTSRADAMTAAAAPGALDALAKILQRLNAKGGPTLQELTECRAIARAALLEAKDQDNTGHRYGEHPAVRVTVEPKPDTGRHFIRVWTAKESWTTEINGTRAEVEAYFVGRVFEGHSKVLRVEFIDV